MTVGLYYYGLRDTNATYAMSFFNLIPMVTFVFSTIVGYSILIINWTYCSRCEISTSIITKATCQYFVFNGCSIEN